MMKQKLFAAVCAFALCAALGTAIHAGQAAETAAPVAENLELTTFRNTSVGGTLSAILPVLGAILLILISMALTFIAGLIPSGMAAKKDPVVALRTE